MANEIVKVYYPDREGNMQFAYCETRGSFQQFVENINSFVGRLDMGENAFLEGTGMQRYRMYWVDEDNDKVLINSDYSLRIFLAKTNGIKKVYIVEKDNPTTPSQPAATQEQQSQAPKQSPTSTTTPRAPNAENCQATSIHLGVQCDGCDAIPIVGFRYKCAQCYDFDLCEKCEQRKVHCDHVMYRFPVPLPRHTELNRRFFKKLRHSVNRGSDGENGERPRKCGRRRHHESANTTGAGGGAASAFTNFYSMMCDLAEGMDHQDVTNATNPPQAEPETQKAQSPNTSSEAPRGGSAAGADRKNESAGECPFMFGGIDPTYAKAGVQALKGFSEIFGKLLDPLGITVEVDVGMKGDKKDAPKAGSSKEQTEGENATSKATTPDNEADAPIAAAEQASSPAQAPIDVNVPIIDLTSSISTSASATSIATEGIRKNSSSSSVNVINDGIRVFASDNAAPAPTAPEKTQDEMEIDLDNVEATFVASKQSETDGASKRRESSPVEASWTLIGKQFDELEINEPSGSEKRAESVSSVSSKASASASANAGATSMPSAEVNFAQLSKDLLTHIQAEEREKQQAEERAKQQAEERARAQLDPKVAASVIYHPDKNINNAVIAMMSMGFSNEGGWLTNLLEQVDGDLPSALELMHPSR